MANKNGILLDEAMLELFRSEVEQQAASLINGMPRLLQDGASPEYLDPLIRAAHSIKGAGRLIGMSEVAKLAQHLESCLNGAQRGHLDLKEEIYTLIINSVEMLVSLAELTKDPQSKFPKSEYDNLLSAWQRVDVLGEQASKEAEQVAETSTTSGVDLDAGRDEGGDESVRPKSQASAELAVDVQPVIESADLAESQEVDASQAPSVPLEFSSDTSMLELFRIEVEQHGHVITEGLLKLEGNPASTEVGESLMRAAHSIKGAARLIGLNEAVKLAHLMEDYLVAIREGKSRLSPEGVDVLFKSNDMLSTLALLTEQSSAELGGAQNIMYQNLLSALDMVIAGKSPGTIPVAKAHAKVDQDTPKADSVKKESSDMGDSLGGSITQLVAQERNENKGASSPGQSSDRVLRISSEQLNRLMGLAGESMVEARWLRPYAESMLQLKRRQADIITLLDGLREILDDGADRDKLKRYVRDTQVKAAECRQILAGRLADLESYDRRVVNLSSRLRREVVTSRMRPFGDGLKGFPRLVRDLARQLGKQAQLHIDGQATMVDRDILEKIEAPLNHLLRNAIDHGIETTEEREKAGKPACGTIRLSAYHHAGMLSIVMEDDGRGVNIERLRSKVVERNLVSQDMANNLGIAELMEFLFLPNFSTRDKVTDLSGRGVGLDVVHDVVQEMRGIVRATSQYGAGTRFQLQLPLTLSVLPALIVEVYGEAYAFPLARIERIMHVESSQVREIEGHQYVSVGDYHIGLVSAHQLLGFNEAREQRDSFPVVVLGDRKKSYGLVIDRFLGERDLVVHVLPSRLGKVRDISSASLMEDGTPLLIFDVDDIFRSLEKIISAGRLNRVRAAGQDGSDRVSKRILVVDDSITVREVERKLLEASGYEVEIAVDGMDGWNALRESDYDLVITDIDMPRMDGIELVKLIRSDAKLQKIPVMIVSYKDREEDRFRGLEAGADYYLTKGSFHDETLREAVVDLIGAAA